MVAPPDIDTLRKIIMRMAKGKAPGLSGWTAEMILPLLNDSTCMQGLQMLFLDIANGEVFAPRHSRDLILACNLIPARKKNTQIRPIAIGGIFYRVTAKWLLDLCKKEFSDTFEPIQFGMGAKGGSASALHAIKSAIAH